MNQQNLETIKKTAEEFFQKTTFGIEVEVLPEEEGAVPINLETEEPQILIGEGGQTLAEIQHLLKAILKRKISEPFYINLDINNYKQKKYEYLKEMARSAADEVALAKKEKTLVPMPAYERRIIHLELSNRLDVITESMGREPERKVVIRPRPQ
ncbi:MAG: R3H domain-containing nucleic acid-binding protein [bacterium]|nr:R3H domain-containing nucleic acid-binding protein [bacterium]